jgi:hypothetical protein
VQFPEDNVAAALRILEHEAQVQDKVVTAAQKYLELAVTRYKGGVTSYLEVTTAQSAASRRSHGGEYPRPPHGVRSDAGTSPRRWMGSFFLAPPGMLRQTNQQLKVIIFNFQL